MLLTLCAQSWVSHHEGPLTTKSPSQEGNKRWGMEGASHMVNFTNASMTLYPQCAANSLHPHDGPVRQELFPAHLLE